MKGKILIFLIVFKGTGLFGQGLSHQVLLPAAGVINTDGISYSQTIGEAAVESLSSSGYDLTQGFQQPRLKMLPGISPPGNGVKAYPNPASDFVNVELFGETARSFRITVSNISGTVVYSNDINFTDKYWYIQDIPVSTLSPGLYFIQVISKDGVLHKSFKIEKL